MNWKDSNMVYHKASCLWFACDIWYVKLIVLFYICTLRSHDRQVTHSSGVLYQLLITQSPFYYIDLFYFIDFSYKSVMLYCNWDLRSVKELPQMFRESLIFYHKLSDLFCSSLCPLMAVLSWPPDCSNCFQTSIIYSFQLSISFMFSVDEDEGPNEYLKTLIMMCSEGPRPVVRPLFRAAVLASAWWLWYLPSMKAIFVLYSGS